MVLAAVSNIDTSSVIPLQSNVRNKMTSIWLLFTKISQHILVYILFIPKCYAAPLQQRETFITGSGSSSYCRCSWQATHGRTQAGGNTRRWTELLSSIWKGNETAPEARLVRVCHHLRLLQALTPRPACQRECVHTGGGSNVPCSCAGGPSCSGWADWPLWSGATLQKEAPQCKR